MKKFTVVLAALAAFAIAAPAIAHDMHGGMGMHRGMHRGMHPHMQHNGMMHREHHMMRRMRHMMRRDGM